MKRLGILIVCAALATGCGGTSGSSGGAPTGLNDLVGMRASYLDSEMADRGYTNKGGYKEMETSYTTWWNASRAHCVSVATVNGKVETVETIAAGNCQ